MGGERLTLQQTLIMGKTIEAGIWHHDIPPNTLPNLVFMDVWNGRTALTDQERRTARALIGATRGPPDFWRIGSFLVSLRYDTELVNFCLQHWREPWPVTHGIPLEFRAAENLIRMNPNSPQTLANRDSRAQLAENCLKHVTGDGSWPPGFVPPFQAPFHENEYIGLPSIVTDSFQHVSVLQMLMRGGYLDAWSRRLDTHGRAATLGYQMSVWSRQNPHRAREFADAIRFLREHGHGPNPEEEARLIATS